MTLMNAPLLAHSVNVPMALLVIHRDGSFTLDANFDLPAYVLNDTPARIGDDSMNAWLDADDTTIANSLNDAKTRLQHAIVFTANDHDFRATLTGFIGLSEVRAYRTSGITPRLPMMAPATLRGNLPAGATSFTLRFPEVLGPVILTLERPAEEPLSASLEPGETSEAFTIPNLVQTTAPPILAASSTQGTAPRNPAPMTNSTPFVVGAIALLLLSITAKFLRRSARQV
jgi:hypothetical protein